MSSKQADRLLTPEEETAIVFGPGIRETVGKARWMMLTAQDAKSYAAGLADGRAAPCLIHCAYCCPSHNGQATAETCQDRRCADMWRDKATGGKNWLGHQSMGQVGGRP